MTELREALLPCPFCGSSNIDAEGWASVTAKGPACDNCGASAGIVSDDHSVNIAAWNNRAHPVEAEALEWRDIARDLAKYPCETKGLEDMEPGSETAGGDNPFAELERWNSLSWQQRYNELKAKYDDVNRKLLATLTAPDDAGWQEPAINWLRSLGDQNPPETLWHAASILADRLAALTPSG